MIGLEVDLLRLGEIIARKTTAGIIRSQHRKLYNQIAAVAQKYEDVFSEDINIQVVNPEVLTEAELRAHLYSCDDSIEKAALSVIALKYQSIIKECRSILNWKIKSDFSKLPNTQDDFGGEHNTSSCAGEPFDIPLQLLPGKGQPMSEIGDDSIEHKHEVIRKKLCSVVVKNPFEWTTGSRKCKSIQSLIVHVDKEKVKSVLMLDSTDPKELFITQEVLELIKLEYQNDEKSLDVTSWIKKPSLHVSLSTKARDMLKQKCHDWQRNTKHHSRYLFWLDSGIKSVFLVHECHNYFVAHEALGSIDISSIAIHMRSNCNLRVTNVNLWQYTDAHTVDSRLLLPGATGFRLVFPSAIPTVPWHRICLDTAYSKYVRQDIGIESMEVTVEGHHVHSVLSIGSSDEKEKFIIRQIVELIDQGKEQSVFHIESNVRNRIAFVTICKETRSYIISLCQEWDANPSNLTQHIFWLDSGIVSIQVCHQQNNFLLAKEIQGKIPIFYVAQHMQSNSGLGITQDSIRKYLEKHQLGETVRLVGGNGLRFESQSAFVDKPWYKYSSDIDRKRRQVQRILNENGIHIDSFSGWDSAHHLLHIIALESRLVSYRNEIKEEIRRYMDILNDEYEYLNEYGESNRGTNIRFRNKKLDEIRFRAEKNIKSFEKTLLSAMSRVTFPIIDQMDRKFPFRERQVDWYSEWLQEFQETECVRRIHVKGSQLEPIVFKGKNEDLLIIGDGRAVSIIVKKNTSSQICKLPAIRSKTATSQNVLYAMLVLSQILNMQKDLAAILRKSNDNLQSLVKHSEKFTKQLIRNDSQISVLQIENYTDKLTGLTPELRHTVVRTVIDLLMGGTISPRIECKGMISSSYIDCIHARRTESDGTLILNSMIPLAGIKMWKSVGELELTTRLIYKGDAIRLSHRSGSKWNIRDGGKYVPPVDEELIANCSMLCG